MSKFMTVQDLYWRIEETYTHLIHAISAVESATAWRDKLAEKLRKMEVRRENLLKKEGKQ